MMKAEFEEMIGKSVVDEEYKVIEAVYTWHPAINDTTGMALLEVKTEWAVYKDCFLQVARYQADNSRAIEIWNNEDGPIARITVCITGSGLAEDETVIDTNNCPWAMEFIKQHGFGQATGRMVKSGYCTYPVVKLDIEKIGEYLEVA